VRHTNLVVIAAAIFVLLAGALSPARSEEGPPAPKAGSSTAVAPTGGVTLDAVRAGGHLHCGIVTEQDDWNRTDIHGNLSALGLEICRAVTIAILGDDDPLQVHEFPAEPESLAALKDGTVQLVTTISPETTIATQYGVAFGPPIFFDTQRLLVSHLDGIARIEDLRDQLICVQSLTPMAQTLRDEMSARGIPFAIMAHQEQGEMDAAIAVHHCKGEAGMESRLAQSRIGFHARISDFDFLPERFGLEPVAPAYRYGDQRFGLIVDWTIYALIEAEALGITKANVVAGREDMRAQRLLGDDFATAQSLGLAHDWSAKVVGKLGNYGEIFARTIGAPYHLDRGLNRLWTDGGLMRPLPIR
jgi:general L-amino acid transport system substrate-binding protein